jgi:hypothetical protein
MLQSIDTLIAFVVIMTVASLFVTILTQILSAALSLRGKNLANALALTFQTIEPKIDEKAHQLAVKILTDPLLSDSTLTVKEKKKGLAKVPKRKKPWKFQDLAGAAQLASAIRGEEVYSALRRLKERKDKLGTENVSAEATALMETAEQILHALDQTPVGTTIIDARAKFQKWFDSGQDRATQWFQLHTRSLTIAGSIFIALLLQLDAVEIFHFISTNAAARTALVASADAVVKTAGDAADEKGGLIKRIADAATAPGQPRLDLAGIKYPDQLAEKLKERDGAAFNQAAFDDLVRRTSRAYFNEQRERVSDLTREVSATGFEFIPVGYWRWPTTDGATGHVTKFFRHAPGMALFAALLTLGAPYWFNMLKNLSSLRPALARTISQEDAAAPP